MYVRISRDTCGILSYICCYYIFYIHSTIYIFGILLYAFLYLLVVNQSILFDILNFHLIHMDPESYFSCIIIELRLERHTSNLFFFFFFIWDSLTRCAILRNWTIFVKFRILYETKPFLIIIRFHIPFYCIEGKCFCCILLACVL